MTITTDSTPVATFVAIDIAKHRHDVMIEQSDGTIEAIKVANTLEDFQRLSAFLRRDHDGLGGLTLAEVLANAKFSTLEWST